MIKQKWFTLSESGIGTHKQGFAGMMTKEEAEKLGRHSCNQNGQIYVGTYLSSEIHIEEDKLRKILYK